LIEKESGLSIDRILPKQIQPYWLVFVGDIAFPIAASRLQDTLSRICYYNVGVVTDCV